MDPRELKIMADVVVRYDKCRMLQIGTSSGTTVFHMAPILRKIGGKLVTVDIDKSPGGGTYDDPIVRNSKFQTALTKSGYEDVVEVHRNGSDVFFEQNKDKFDVIFIDGDHRYEQAKRDFDNSVLCMVHNGTIFLHDIMDRTQKQPRHKSVARVYDEFEREGWFKELYKTNHKLARIRRNY